VKRLQKFMLIVEVPSLPSGTTNAEENELTGSKEAVIALRNLSAQWLPKVKMLENVNLAIKAKSLTAVVGQVGSGKTSLLHAILKELPYTSGELHVQGLISYASQEPWIFTSTVRQNILFGHPLDKARYEKVIDVCQLRKDLDIFPDGDATMVGEKGINLSGGQCARLNLARAIYRDTDIYLLDDPLSAVDAAVGRKIFQDCIKTNLKEKTVILVTHQFQYLEEVDRIVVLNNGSVEITGTFAELQSAGLYSVQVMQMLDDIDDAKTPGRADFKSACKEIMTESIVEKKERLAEKKFGGSISAKTYLSYFLSSNNIPLVLLVAFISILHQLAASGGDYFLAYWVNSEENATSRRNETCEEFVCINRERYIYLYGGITIATITLCIMQSLTFFEMSMRIANNLHATMFTSVIFATIDFFTKNPLGRIMNR
jgi:ATP-binding cassette subfamily C (CFTR/MRP) protein 4